MNIRQETAGIGAKIFVVAPFAFELSVLVKTGATVDDVDRIWKGTVRCMTFLTAHYVLVQGSGKQLLIQGIIIAHENQTSFFAKED